MPKTNRDFLYALFERMVGNDQSKLMQISFEQQFLPMFPQSKKLDEIIPDEQFAQMLAKMEPELPAFMRFLETNKFPSLPPTFGSKN